MTIPLVCEKEQATTKTNAGVLRCAQNDKRFFMVRKRVLWFAEGDEQRATASAVRWWSESRGREADFSAAPLAKARPASVEMTVPEVGWRTNCRDFWLERTEGWAEGGEPRDPSLRSG